MQSTGQTSTQEVSFVPIHGSLITYATATSRRIFFHTRRGKISEPVQIYPSDLCKACRSMDVPSQPDALALPTRRRLFAELGELRRPAGTEELAARVGLHPNGVR